MIIGIDLHGVIDSNVDSFRGFLSAYTILDIPIYIISGPPKTDIEIELHNYDIYEGTHFNRIISVVDFLKNKKVKMWTDEKGRWWASDEDWWSSKAEICKMYSVDIMIDDQERYGSYFKDTKTRFILHGG